MGVPPPWCGWTIDKPRTLEDNLGLYLRSIACSVRLAELLPADTKVCVVADRGFGDRKLYRFLTEELCFDYVIRFRGNIAITAVTGGNPHCRRLGAGR